jgi:hypothetical protein
MPDIVTSNKPKLWKMELKRGSIWPPYFFKINDANGNPRSFTGATILMQIKKEAADAIPVMELRIGSGFTLSQSDTVVTFTPGVISLNPESFIADLLIIWADGTPKYQFDFQINVLNNISRQ